MTVDSILTKYLPGFGSAEDSSFLKAFGASYPLTFHFHIALKAPEEGRKSSLAAMQLARSALGNSHPVMRQGIRVFLFHS